MKSNLCEIQALSRRHPCRDVSHVIRNHRRLQKAMEGKRQAEFTPLSEPSFSRQEYLCSARFFNSGDTSHALVS
ncbi:Uncharacterized protein HZ326_28922 [Fusarium oxysporum f. sp. albedinis]|nr:Uncharacterized protein HZ326_28922 [Fusarium oxysporum f. sp. albedinis]